MNAAEHEWTRDERGRGEGLACQNCDITEAEMEAANGNLDGCITAPWPGTEDEDP